MKKSTIFLIAFCLVIIVMIFIVPDQDSKKSKIYKAIDLEKVVKIEYQGAVVSNKNSVGQTHYTLQILRDDFYRDKSATFFTLLSPLSKGEAVGGEDLSFYGAPLVSSMIQDIAQLESEQWFAAEDLSPYQFNDCQSSLTIFYQRQKRQYCIGGDNFGQTKKYLLDKQNNFVVVVNHYVIDRFMKNPLFYKAKDLLPVAQKTIAALELNLSQTLLHQHRLIKEKLGDKFHLQHHYNENHRYLNPKTGKKSPPNTLSRWNYHSPKITNQSDIKAEAQILKDKILALELLPLVADDVFLKDFQFLFSLRIVGTSTLAKAGQFELTFWESKFPQSFYDAGENHTAQTRQILLLKFLHSSQKQYFHIDEAKYKQLQAEWGMLDSSLSEK